MLLVPGILSYLLNSKDSLEKDTFKWKSISLKVGQGFLSFRRCLKPSSLSGVVLIQTPVQAGLKQSPGDVTGQQSQCSMSQDFLRKLSANLSH